MTTETKPSLNINYSNQIKKDFNNFLLIDRIFYYIKEIKLILNDIEIIKF